VPEPGADRTQPATPPGAPAALEPLRQIQAAARALLDQGQVEETWAYLLTALEAVLVQNRDLTLLVAKLRRAYRGTCSEQVDPGQLACFSRPSSPRGPPRSRLIPRRRRTRTRRGVAGARDSATCPSGGRAGT
jgi:hypothetical protein